MIVEETLKVTKDMIQKLLGPAKDVLAVLNVVSTIHPGVQVITILASVLE